MHPGKTLHQVLTITPQADGNFSSSPRFFSENVPPPPQLKGEAIQTLLNYTFYVSVKACKNTDRRQPFLNLN